VDADHAVKHADGGARCKKAKRALPAALLFHYVDEARPTDADLLPFATPPNPCVRLKKRRCAFACKEDVANIDDVADVAEVAEVADVVEVVASMSAEEVDAFFWD
jgi:hypothetical protein